jgi:hypothetical protein
VSTVRRQELLIQAVPKRQIIVSHFVEVVGCIWILVIVQSCTHDIWSWHTTIDGMALIKNGTRAILYGELANFIVFRLKLYSIKINCSTFILLFFIFLNQIF